MRKSALLVAFVAAALMVPLGVYASHQFNDVPDSHLFHNAIDWMKDNNVTSGCNPPANDNYCPDDGVTRGQMAAFMKRLSENQIVDAGALEGYDASYFSNPTSHDLNDNVNLVAFAVTKVGEVTVSAPGDGGLLVTGEMTWNTDTTGSATFWHQLDNTTCEFSIQEFYSINYGRHDQQGSNGSASGAIGVSEGDHTVTLCARVYTGGPLSVDTSLVATYVSSVTRTGSISAAGGSGGPGTPDA